MRFLTVILPNSEQIHISKTALGTTYFGSDISEETAFDLMDRYVALGGNCIDTARVYADWIENGASASERCVGRWLESRGIRDKMIISTKGAHPAGGIRRLNRADILSDIDESLEALKIRYTDLYFLHRDDLDKDVGEIMPVLHELVQSGKVRALGASNWTVARIAEANAFAEKHHLTPFSISQIQWSLAKAVPEDMNDPTLVCMNDTEYQWYLEHQFPVMAFSSQAKGLFSKAIALGEKNLNEKIRTRFLKDCNRGRLKLVAQYCAEHQVSPAAVVLAYLNCNSVPALSILGCSSVAQLEDSMFGGDYLLPQEFIEQLANA